MMTFSHPISLSKNIFDFLWVKLIFRIFAAHFITNLLLNIGIKKIKWCPLNNWNNPRKHIIASINQKNSTIFDSLGLLLLELMASYLCFFFNNTAAMWGSLPNRWRKENLDTQETG